MKAFADKIRDARTELGLSQPQLAEKCGLSVRVILDYEKGKKRPRPTTMMKLAKALQVSTKFLSDDECDNPMEDIEKDGYIEEARIRYGSNGAKEVDALLAANKALFAGGELSDDQKERFFQAITEAYFACREEAKKKYGRKKSDNQQ